MVDTVRSPFRPGFYDDFGVGPGGKAMTAPFQFRAQFPEVVNLAIEDQADIFVLAVHGLVARREVDHRQPPVGEAKTGLEMKAVAIRSAMLDGVAHRAHHGAIGQPRPLQVKPSGDSAHYWPPS